MRILYLSFFFPPYNSIGAVRSGKLTKYLHRLGHDVRVVSGRDQPAPSTLPLELPPERIEYTAWLDFRRLAGGKGYQPAKPGADGPRAAPRSFLKVKALLWQAFKTIFYFPDMQVGWFGPALRAARRLAREWQPDVIYASAMPYTSLLVARRLSRELGVPWVGELRDLWADHQAYPYPAWRRWIESRMEKSVLSSARALVTVSQPLAEKLRAKYACPVHVITNGFDAEDYAGEPCANTGSGPLRIVYTGTVYKGKQDPGPLFEAVRQLGPDASRIRIEFYGRLNELLPVGEQAARMGVAERVEIKGPVPFTEVTRLQREADVLLMLIWTDLRERGVFTGKLFEYLGARRPILAVGPSQDVAAQLILGRQAGAVLKDPARIAAQLSDWLAQKNSAQGLPPLPAAVGAGYTRASQAAQLADCLTALIGATKPCAE